MTANQIARLFARASLWDRAINFDARKFKNGSKLDLRDDTLGDPTFTELLLNCSEHQKMLMNSVIGLSVLLFGYFTIK